MPGRARGIEYIEGNFMRLLTIGFNGKTARGFFESIKSNGIKRLIDVRLGNTSQLAGFTKKDDLEYFLHEIAGADYVHVPLLAPPRDILKKYKADKDWAAYEAAYIAELDARNAAAGIGVSLFDRDAVLLCGEETAEHCHRRLAAEYLSKHFPITEIIHI